MRADDYTINLRFAYNAESAKNEKLTAELARYKQAAADLLHYAEAMCRCNKTYYTGEFIYRTLSLAECDDTDE